MSIFNKKDKRYNDYFDNYSNKQRDNFIGGLIFIIIGLVCYGMYKLAQWI